MSPTIKQLTFNAAVGDVVRHLISRAAITVPNTGQVFQIASLEVSP